MKTDDELTPLWEEYIRLKETSGADEERNALRNRLAGEYYEIVKDVADRMALRLSEVDAEQCASYGVDGLYDAIDKFDISLGNKFKTFAHYRVKGAILDNIRKVDWVPRLVRSRSGSIEEARQSYYKKNGRYPSDDEILDLLDSEIGKHYSKFSKTIPVNTVSIHASSKTIFDNESEDMSNFIVDEGSDPVDGLLRTEMFSKLMGKNFTRLERKIVYYHYYEGFTMKEIADRTDFSESRISQMHADILRRLRKKMSRNPSYVSGLEKLFESI